MNFCCFVQERERVETGCCGVKLKFNEQHEIKLLANYEPHYITYES